MADQSFFSYAMAGAKELDEALELIKDLPTQERIVEKAMKKALKPTRDMAKQLAPDDRGDLSDSIIITKKMSKRQKRRDQIQGFVMYVGSFSPIAHLVEFGTKAHTVVASAGKVLAGKWGAGGRATYGKEANIPNIAPEPFMRPALDATERQVTHRFGELMWIEIARLAKRLNKRAAKGKLTAADRRSLGIR